MIVYDKEQKQIVIPNGIGNIDIYNNGVEAGYNQGKIDGIEEQKSKLESINITENGTYANEDGYNHIEVNVPDLNGDYNEGYDQGQTDLVANARDIEVTKNGTYQSKYSDPILPTVTGVYADDTKFYGYAELNGKVFNTKIAGSVDSRLEFWYKGDNAVSGLAGYCIIIGAGDKNRVNCFQIRYYAEENNTLWVEIDGSEIKVYNWDDTVWHHLIVSKAEGLWIDGKKKGDFSPTTNTIKGEFYINGAAYDKFGNRPANGYFGMIKIDDAVIIPTANGFKKVNGDEMLQVVKDGSYTFAENLPTYGEGELYKTINVNVDIDSYYNNGYNQGKTDGIREQRLKLESINITENGNYYKEDGYREVVVNVPDLNGSYDEGYAEGERVGYEQGKTDGVNEQKGKLTQITISENGTYDREDGYSHIEVNVPDLNGSYDEGYKQGKTEGEQEGYKQGQADLAANARVLNVTENGVYKSKYSDPIIPDTYTVTGVYDNGTNFYSYAELTNKVFNTKIAGSVDSRLEFWYKGDNTISGNGWNVIIGSGDNVNNAFQVRYYVNSNDILIISIGNSSINIRNWDDTIWHHLIISKAEGIWIDGEKKGDFSPTNTVDGEFFINGVSYDTDGTRNANGCFGMIKINDVIIIPTADGFLNTNTGELLEVVKDGGYNFTENLPTYPEGEGELYKTINVNIDVDSYYNNGYNQGKTDGVNEQKGKLESISITENGTYDREDGYSHIEVNVPDLNGSYDEGYSQGHTEGYNEGKTDGINEQKGKLESINITENGTYRKEDGYNEIVVEVPGSSGDYNEGYEQGQADVAANARVLDVTENGTYMSKFSDSIIPTDVTGVYGDGTDFYSYAYLNNIQYNTNIYPMSNTKIEIWWKYDGSKEGNEGCIIGCQKWGYANSIFKIGWNYGDNRLLASVNDNTIFIPFIEGWNHIVMSYADGLWLNGVKIGTFPSNITDDMDNKEPICINGYYGNSRMNSDYFGMVKINDVVIIPTANGFQNVNTGELLEVVKDGDYTFTENLPIYAEGELYKTINVNVLPKVNVKEAGLRFGYSIFTEVPEWADFKDVTDMSNMFSDCRNLQTVPQIDTSNVTNMSYMFYKCGNLQTIPLLDTSNVTNMENMFAYCNLQTIPLFNTSNVTNMSYMFSNCSNLQTIPQIDTSNVTNMASMFASCSSLVSIPALNAQKLSMNQYSSLFGYGEKPKLTDFGGLLNLKSSLTSDYNFKSLPNLTYESCINILNGLYDFTGNGETPNSNQGKLKVHQNFLDKVGDEISIGTAKGWSISA